MKKERALFLFTNNSSFVRGDIDILSEKYTVGLYQVDNSSQLMLAHSMLKLFIFLLFNTFKYKVIFVWFADYHSFLPILAGKLLGKKSVIVAGGYDVCREKKYNYGSFVNPLRAKMALFSLRNASVCLAVSKNIERIVKKISPKGNCILLYNGVSLSPGLARKVVKAFNKTGGVLCVSIVNSEQSYYIKGVDRFIAAARELPNTPFTLVGASRDFIKQVCPDIPTNLFIAGKVDHSEVINYYAQAKVYCQLSRRESFCLALAESMMFNCFPVISNVGGMPEVVGANGIIVNDFSPESLSAAIKSALEKDNSKYNFAKRIEDNFLYEERKTKLLQILESK